MGQPTTTTIKRLFALSGNICAFPGCQLPIIESGGTVTGEICHIHARNSGGPRFDESQSDAERNDFDNLILLCRAHHKVVDSQIDSYSADVLREIKEIHQNVAGRPERPADSVFAKILLNGLQQIDISDNTGNIAINSPGAIQARTVNIKSARNHVAVNAPPGTIGSDQGQSRYVQYLINRYNQFARENKSRSTKFSYGAISVNIERRYGASWKLLPSEKFEELCDYLQQRILKTIIGRLNTGKGQKSFSTYSEFSTKTSTS